LEGIRRPNRSGGAQLGRRPQGGNVQLSHRQPSGLGEDLLVAIGKTEIALSEGPDQNLEQRDGASVGRDLATIDRFE
jgi:hypothetical protein